MVVISSMLLAIQYTWLFSCFTDFFFIFVSLLEVIANSDRRHGLEFDCNQEVLLVRGARPLKGFNLLHLATIATNILG